MYESLDFEKVVKDCTGGNAKIKQSNYLTEGLLPVVDQGQELVAGYVDDESLKYKGNLPCVIFGDHTCILKYVDFDFVLGADGTKILVPGADEINAKYLYYFLNTVHIPDRGYSRHFKYLKRCKIPVVSLSDQKQIVQILDTVDTLRQKRKEQINLIDDYLKSVFFEMFGDPVDNDKEWEFIKLEEVIIDGPSNGLYKPANFYGEGIPILRIDCFYDGVVTDQTSFKRIAVSKEELKRFQIFEDDIVINRVNSRSHLGKCAFIPKLKELTVYESNMMRFTVDKSKILPLFLTKLLITPFIKNQILNSAKDAVNQSSINQKDVKNFRVYLPPIDLQNKFASIVEQVEATKQKMRASLDEMDNHFNALMQRYFG